MASNLGNIKSCPRTIEKSNGRKETRKGRPIVPITDKYGYKVVTICLSGKEMGKKVHRLIAETFLADQQFLGAQVNHIDGDKSNNTVSNLEWTTSKQNVQHSVSKGLHCTGARHDRSRAVVNVVSGQRFVSIKAAAVANNIVHSTLKAKLQKGKEYRSLRRLDSGDYTINYPEWPQ